MDQVARMKQITGYFEQSRWSAALTDAVTNYLGGAGTLAQVDQAWESFNNRAPLTSLWGLRILSDLEDGLLGALDLRWLDLFLFFGDIDIFLYEVRWCDVAQQIADHLRSRGMDEQTIRQHFFSGASRAAFEFTETLTPMGRYLLAYLPEHAEEMFNAQKPRYKPHYSRFFRLLLLVQPPVPEVVWQFAQKLEQEEIESYDLQSIAALLLQADPARYTPWARRLAGQTSPLASEFKRQVVLSALMNYYPTQHIDLALEAAQMPITERSASTQCHALRKGFAFDPIRFWPALEAAAVSRNYWLGATAVELLKQVPFAQACPVLQRCVVEAHAQIGYRALKRLLTQPWAGQQVFLRMRLSHRSKRIREQAAAALKSRGVAIP